jgi:uncharacterized membrane protein (DUF4010 family)
MQHESPVVGFAVALGIGLLIGVERERRKGEGPFRAAAGIRTFAISAILGALAIKLGGVVLLAVALAGVLGLSALSYSVTNSDDPGLTTEIALPLTVLLGALAVGEPVLAAGLAVIVAILLAMRTPMHAFVRRVLTEAEIKSAMIFAASSLIILPLLPDRFFGPYDAVNPRNVWSIALIIMAISTVGHIAVRAFGARFGLPLAGLASGFVSSAATIGAMGTRAARDPGLLVPAVAAAVLSSVATILQMAVVVGGTNLATLKVLALPLACAGVAAFAYGAVFTMQAAKSAEPDASTPGQVFDPLVAVFFALTLTAVLLVTSALKATMGQTGVILAAVLAGFVDTHSAAVSVASLVSAGKLDAGEAILPIMAALSSNTITKIILASGPGRWSFATRVIPGLLLIIVAAWIGTAL